MMENFIYANLSDLNAVKVNGNNLVIMLKTGGCMNIWVQLVNIIIY